MKDFLFLFRSTEAGARAAMGTPEAAQRSLQTWLAWIHDLEAGGHLKERGHPMDRDGRVVGIVNRRAQGLQIAGTKRIVQALELLCLGAAFLLALHRWLIVALRNQGCAPVSLLRGLRGSGHRPASHGHR